MIVELRYGIRFGKGDSTGWIDWEIELSPEEEIAYNNAIENEIPLNEVEELEEVLYRAYNEIEEVEINNGIEYGDEFTMECQGEIEMNADELNELVSNHDPYTLAFFNLAEASNDEISEWNANDLDELPLMKDFIKDFKPISPYDSGWYLEVEFVDPNEDF